jgi:hypothetical protein
MHKGANHEKEKNILGTNIDIVVDNVSIWVATYKSKANLQNETSKLNLEFHFHENDNIPQNLIGQQKMA